MLQISSPQGASQGQSGTWVDLPLYLHCQRSIFFVKKKDGGVWPFTGACQLRVASTDLRSTRQRLGSTRYPRNSTLRCWKEQISGVWHGATSAASDSGLPWHSLCACWALENIKMPRIPLHSYQAGCAAHHLQNDGRLSEHRRDQMVS